MRSDYDRNPGEDPTLPLERWVFAFFGYPGVYAFFTALVLPCVAVANICMEHVVVRAHRVEPPPWFTALSVVTATVGAWWLWRVCTMPPGWLGVREMSEKEMEEFLHRLT